MSFCATIALALMSSGLFTQDSAEPLWEFAGEIKLPDKFYPLAGPTLAADGKRVACAGISDASFAPKTPQRGCTVLIHTLPKGTPAGTLSLKTIEQPNRIQFSPDGKLLAISGPVAAAKPPTKVWGLELWDPLKQQLRKRWTFSCSDDRHTLRSLWSFSPDGKTLAVCDWATAVKLIDVATLTERGKIPVANAQALAFSPDGKTLALAVPNRVKVWDLRNGNEIADLGPLAKTDVCYEGTQLSFIGNSSLLVCHDAMTGKVRNDSSERTRRWSTWDIAAGKESTWLPEKIDANHRLLASNDGKTLFSREFPLAALAKGAGGLPGFGIAGLEATSPGGFVAGKVNTVLRVWDAKSKKEKSAFTFEGGSLDASLTPDARLLAIVYGAPGGPMITSQMKYFGGIGGDVVMPVSIEMTPKGPSMATAFPMTIRLWQLK